MGQVYVTRASCFYCCSAVLPFPTTETVGGPRAILIRFTCFNPKEFKIEDVIKTIVFVTEIMSLEDDNLVVAGEVSPLLCKYFKAG